MNLKDKVKNLPSSPGVYLMKDSSNHIIYVGKSKNLKSRVQSYFYNSKNHSPKVEKLGKQIKDIDYIRTDTEFEAFMLECQLIKKLQPMFNRMMKSPKVYSYILIQQDKGHQRIKLTNQINEENGPFYFGPFTSRRNAEKAINGLKEFFKISCNHPFNYQSPCFNHSLGLCMGICYDYSAIKQYDRIISRIIALLQGTDKSILEEMKQRMIVDSMNSDFESAAKIRDDLEAITSLMKKEKVIKFTRKPRNILVVETIDLKVKMFLINGNKVLFKELFEKEHTDTIQLNNWMKSKVLSYFKPDHPNSPSIIKKEEIDEAQIIYSYLKSNACEYMIIPKKWLQKEEHDKLNKAIEKFIKTKIIKSDPNNIYFGS